jgi:TRAP-type C4-dicarboxylate transport system substrate-binding protein
VKGFGGQAVLGLVAALLAAAPAVAAEFTMKFGTATMNESQHQYLKFYKEALEKASGGRIEVQVFPNSQLGAIPREIEGVQTGAIEAFMGPVDFFVGVDPRFGVFSAPMLFRDDANTAATIHDSVLEPKLLSLAEAKGLVGMATLSVGAADYAAKKPLLRLADFSGKKLRINGTELERQKMSRLGATGIAMPLSEVMPALDQGVIDGTISNTSVFVAFKMIDLVKVITIANDTQIVSIAVVSKRWLEKLPPDLQKLVLDTAREVEAKDQAYEVDFSKQLEQQWTGMGGEIHMLPPDDLAKMKTLLTSVGDEVAKDNPPVRDMLAEVRAAAARH